MGNDTVQREKAYLALYDKRVALSRYSQILLKKTAQDPDLVNIEHGRARIEIELVFAIMSEMANNRPMKFPDDPTIHALAADVAKLTQLVNANAGLNELIEAGDALIDAWPN